MKSEQHNASLAALNGSVEFSGSSEGYTSTPSGGASPSTSFGASTNAESVSVSSSLASPSVKALEEPRHVAATEPRSRSAFFEIGTELSSALYINRCNTGFDDLRHPDFFKYGLRFTPSHDQGNVYRTVTISGLPANITISMVLNGVRGGAVLESQLLNTLRISGSITALIIFLHEHSAFAYEEHAKKHPIIFNGLVANVAVVPTPTWPIKPKLRKAVFNHQHSRCLEVHNFPRSISPSELRKDIGHYEVLRFDHLVHTEMRKDGILVLQFSSIDGAGWAYGMLSSFRAYRDCEPYFTSDPCSQPLETLLPNTKIDSHIAKSQNLVHSRPSFVSKTSSSVSSDGISSSELIASAEP